MVNPREHFTLLRSLMHRTSKRRELLTQSELELQTAIYRLLTYLLTHSFSCVRKRRLLVICKRLRDISEQLYSADAIFSLRRTLRKLEIDYPCLFS